MQPMFLAKHEVRMLAMAELTTLLQDFFQILPNAPQNHYLLHSITDAANG
jgi:hypothetical protein